MECSERGRCREGGRGRDTGAPALRHSGSQLSRAALNSYY